MKLQTWESRHEEIKTHTLKIKQYLARNTIKILGKEEWQFVFGQDPADIDYGAVSANDLVRMACIVADDPVQGALVCNIFLTRLERAIALRKYQNERYTPHTCDDQQFKEDFLTHLHFINELERVRGHVLAAIRIHYLPRTGMESSQPRMNPNRYSGLSSNDQVSDSESDHAPPSPNSEQGPSSPRSDSGSPLIKGPSQGNSFYADLLAHLGSFWGLKGHTNSLWNPYLEGKSSVLLSGLRTDFAFRLVEEAVGHFVFVQEDLCDVMPMASYHDACPNTGLGGIIHCMFLSYEKAHEDAASSKKPELAKKMYNAAEELFMPAQSIFLNHWIKQVQQNREALSGSEEFMPFGTKIPLEDKLELGAVSPDGSFNPQYQYYWKTFVGEDTLREYYRLATFDSKPSRPPTIWKALDHLSRTLKTTVVGTNISHSAGINLDLMLGAHQILGERISKPRQKAQKVAQATLRSLESFEELTDAMKEVGQTAADILEDRMVQEATQSGLHKPSAFFLQKSNPVLCVVQMFTNFYLHQKAAQDLEQRMPYMHIAITLYRMVRRILSHLKLTWPDADYVLQRFGTRRVLGTNTEQVRAIGYSGGLNSTLRDPTSPSSLLPMMSPLVECVMDLATGKETGIMDRILENLNKSRDEKPVLSSPILKGAAHTPSKMKSKRKLAIDTTANLRRLDLRVRTPPSPVNQVRHGDQSPSRGSSTPASPKSRSSPALSPKTPTSQKTKQKPAPRIGPDASYKSMTQSLNRFQEEFSKEDFHMYLDYLAFWVICNRVADMTVETWLRCTNEKQVPDVDEADRWVYVDDFMEFAKREDGESYRMPELFAEGLQEILVQFGGRSEIVKAEDLSGLKCESF